MVPVIETARVLRKRVRPMFLGTPLKWVYDYIGWILTTMIVNYVFCPFTLRDAGVSIGVWYSVGFWGHIAPISILGLLQMQGINERIELIQAINRREHEGSKKTE